VSRTRVFARQISYLNIIPGDHQHTTLILIPGLEHGTVGLIRGTYDSVAPVPTICSVTGGLTPWQLLLLFLFHIAIFKSLFIPSQFFHLSAYPSLYLYL
jgi:hypothetical protein